MPHLIGLLYALCARNQAMKFRFRFPEGVMDLGLTRIMQYLWFQDRRAPVLCNEYLTSAGLVNNKNLFLLYSPSLTFGGAEINRLWLHGD